MRTTLKLVPFFMLFAALTFNSCASNNPSQQEIQESYISSKSSEISEFLEIENEEILDLEQIATNADFVELFNDYTRTSILNTESHILTIPYDSSNSYRNAASIDDVSPSICRKVARLKPREFIDQFQGGCDCGLGFRCGNVDCGNGGSSIDKEQPAIIEVDEENSVINILFSNDVAWDQMIYPE